jgi:GT2 family glycosyltransferase
VTSSVSAPRVVVIILTYCNEAEAAACVRSVAASRYPAFEILLVDNASPDGSGARLRARFPDIHHLTAPWNGGYTAGNNRGFEWALSRAYDYVLVLNDDTEIDDDCLAKLVDAARETGAPMVAPQIVYYDEPNVVWYAGGDLSRTRVMCTHFRENLPVDPADTRRPVSFVCGCCFLLRTDVLRSVGGFDESFFTYCEDLELSLKLARDGHQMIYEPSARVLHRIGRAAPPTPNQIRLRDKNRRRVVAKHYGLLEALRFGAWFYPTRAIHLARYIGTGRWDQARAQLSGAFGSLDVPPRK